MTIRALGVAAMINESLFDQFSTATELRGPVHQCCSNATVSIGIKLWCGRKIDLRDMRARKSTSVLLIIKAVAASEFSFVYVVYAFLGSAARGVPENVLKRLVKWAL